MLDSANGNDKTEDRLQKTEGSVNDSSANKWFEEFASSMMDHNNSQLKQGDTVGAEKDIAEANKRLKEAGSLGRVLGRDTDGNGKVDTVDRAVMPKEQKGFIEFPNPYR